MALTLLAPTAQARTITVGSDLTGTFNPSSCGAACSLLNTKVAGTNPVASPVTGAIVRWRITGGTAGVAGYRILVMRPTGTTYTVIAASPPQTPATAGLEVFGSAVPIQAGDLVGIETPSGGALPIAPKPGATYVGWQPPLAVGESKPFIGPIPGELGYNADIQPRPTVSLSSPASGSFKGGTAITIAGADFAAVSAVSFGGVPAPFFAVDSEGVVRAVAPAAAGPGTVPVTVTTVAGQSAVVPSAQFTYTACVVPKLKGKTVKADRRALRRAGCALGKVNRPKGLGKSPKVVKQSAKPGTVLPPGGKVNVKLG